VNSLEKVDAFKRAMILTDEQYDGFLGVVQGLISMEEIGMGGVSITGELPATPEEFDEALLDVAGFVLYLRSDDAPAVDPVDLTTRIPAAIAEIAAEAGIA
jgi:hypothetical protein